MADSSSASPAPRIAIKFGAPSSSTSKSASGARKPNPPSSLGKRPRSHALNQDSDSEDESAFHGRHEAVTAFGANGAENENRRRDPKSAKTDSKPFVITCQPNRDWKADTKAQQGRELLPHEREKQFKIQEKETEPADQDKQIKWGLSVTKKPAAEETDSTSQDTQIAEAETPDKEGDEPSVQDDPRSADQDAMDALLGKDKGKKLVISETDALKRAYDSVGEVSTIEEYEQIPDGEFGLAMLRGMGYNGKDKGNKPKEARRRPALLGLGAKEDEEIKKAELAKKHGHRERRPRLDEYRREKEKERQQREERHSGSYKNERERDRTNSSHSWRHDDRDRDRDRNRDRDRYADRDRDSRRHHDRHSRR